MKLRSLFGRRRAEAEMDEELRLHLEMRAKANVERGMSEQEGRRKALQEFGFVESVKEECRGKWVVFWEQLGREARLALRGLWRSPGFGLVAVLTLGLGIGATTAVFTVVNGLLLKPLPWPDSGRVVSVWEGREDAQFPMAPTQFIELREKTKTLEALTGWSPVGVNLVAEGSPPERFPGAAVTEDFFRVVRMYPAMGTVFSAEQFTTGKDGVAIIGHGIWRDRFAMSRDVVGKVTKINGRERTIIGVMPQGFQTPAKAQFWLPKVFTEHERYDRNYKALPALGRLATGVTLEQARAEWDTYYTALRAEHPDLLTGIVARVNPAASDAIKPIRPALLVLMAAVSVVLLMACVNVANLSLARGARRLGELSVRAALGASRGQLMRQLFVESVALAVLGAVVGLLVAKGLLASLLAMAPGTLPRLNMVRMDWLAMLFTGGICVAAGLVFGIAPAWRLSQRDPARELRDSGQRATASVGWLRRGLAVLQVAAAVVVLIGTGLLLRSFDKLMRQDLGFDPENLMTVRVELPAAKYSSENKRELFAEEVLRELRATPGVMNAAATTYLPFQGWPKYIMRMESNPDVKPGEAPGAGCQGVSDGYLETMGVRLLAGRNLSNRDSVEAPRVCLINEALMRKHFPSGQAIGKRLEIGFSDPPQWMEVVGIISDARNQALEEEPMEQVMMPLAQQGPFMRGNPALSLVVRTRGGAGATESIRAAVWRVDKDQPLHLLRPMTEALVELRSQRRFTVTVLSVFAGAAALLAAIGLFGVMSGNVAARTREFGIRMALGARQSQVTGLALRHGMMTLALGLAFGVFGAWAGARFVRTMLYHTEITDPLAWAAVLGSLLVVGVVASYFPARRAARVNPIVALRHE